MLTIENIEKIKGKQIRINGKIIHFADITKHAHPWWEYVILLISDTKCIGALHIGRIKKNNLEGGPKYDIHVRINTSVSTTIMGINELKDISALKGTMIILLEQLGFK